MSKRNNFSSLDSAYHANPRASSTLQSIHTTSMNNACPHLRGHTDNLFYNPRNAELYHENKLIENKYKWNTIEMEKKYDQGKLPDRWMEEIWNQKQDWKEYQEQARGSTLRQSGETIINENSRRQSRLMFSEDPSLGSIFVKEIPTKHDPCQQQRQTYRSHGKFANRSYNSGMAHSMIYNEFNRMVEKKYNLQNTDFEQMSRENRNFILANMTSKDNIIVFPKKGTLQIDGMPQFSILQQDLRTMKKDKEEQVKYQSTRMRCDRDKQKTDMGIPPPAKGTENQARAGATFDPKNFKGNVELFNHLNEVSLSMLKKKLPMSNSIKVDKHMKNHSAVDDYGIKLPEQDRERLRDSDSDDAREEVQQEQFHIQALQKLHHMLSQQESGKRTHFIPGVNSSAGKMTRLGSILMRQTQSKEFTELKRNSENFREEEFKRKKSKTMMSNHHKGSLGGSFKKSQMESIGEETPLPSGYSGERSPETKKGSKFADLVAKKVSEDYKTHTIQNKYKEARDLESKILAKKIEKYNNRQEISQQIMSSIQKKEQNDNNLSNGGIFNGSLNKQILDRCRQEDSDSDDENDDDPDIVTFDGFYGKKQYKYKQYNRIIKMQKQGKKKANPIEIVLGIKKDDEKDEEKQWILKIQKKYDWTNKKNMKKKAK